MTIESRTVPGQPLFHAVDATWNKNGYHFSFFPNVDSEARTMIMSLIPFLKHHYNDSVVKWLSATAQSRAQGAEWDPNKGYVKTFEDNAVSWMMTEDGFAVFDTPTAPTPDARARPDPSNLLVAANATPGLIDDQDSVGTFDPHGAANTVPSVPPAQLVSGAKANPIPTRVLPSQTGSTGSVSSRSSKSSMTASIFSRMSLIEGSLAKVDKLESMMTLIASKLGMLSESAPPTGAALVPPTPTIAPPEIVHVQTPAALTSAAPVSQVDYSYASSANVSSPTRPGGVRPLTHEGTPSSPRTLHENRQSHSDTVSADVSTTGVGQAG